MEKVIEVKNLKKRYKEVIALKGISFEVYKGEIFTIVGPNGAGKTTTLEIIEGLRKADSGEVKLFGERNYLSKYKTKIGVQLQNSRLMNRLKVKEILNFYSVFYPDTYDIDQLLDKVNLNEKASTLVKDLSGGQRQRLAIAISIINKPEVIFLDEPTTGLDPASRRELWDIILSFKKEGKTVILTTHYMDEAEKLSSRVMIINKGEIVKIGSPLNLIKESQIKNKVIISADSIHYNKIYRFLDNSKVSRFFQDKEKIIIYINELEKFLSDLFNYIKINNIQINEIFIKHPSLDDIFLLYTGKEYKEIEV